MPTAIIDQNVAGAEQVSDDQVPKVSIHRQRMHQDETGFPLPSMQPIEEPRPIAHRGHARGIVIGHYIIAHNSPFSKRLAS